MSEFLITLISYVIFQSVLSHMGSLSLSHNNYLPPYPLHQYVQHNNCNLLKTLSDLEFLNVSSSAAHSSAQVFELNMTSHLLGLSGSLNSQKVFLEQTQSLHLQFVSLNLSKLLKSRKTPISSDRKQMLEQVVCCDTFITLDMMSASDQRALPPPLFQLYPPRLSAALDETERHSDSNPEDGLFHARVAVEDVLLKCLEVPSPHLPHARLCEFKVTDSKKYCHVKEVQLAVSQTVSSMNLMSRAVMDEFSALRQICKTETIKEDIGAKRRFKHYLDKEIQCSNREFLSSHWLGS